jgi:HAE1 family hydrophobic/amphiphilic exporter-1
MEQNTAERLRREFERIPNLDARLGRPSFFSLKTPVELIFFCEDLELLKSYTLSLKPKLNDIPGLVDVRASLEAGNPELNVVFDRELLARQGLTVGDLSETLNGRVNGTVVSQFKERDRLIDIRLRNREIDRDSINDIENIVVAQRDGQPITLKAVASLEPARGPSEIHRLVQSRASILSADLQGRGLGSVMTDIRQLIAENPPPPDIEFRMGGQNEEMETSFASMKFAMALAIFLVYLVMAATFENLIHPLIILFSIPLALTGVILGLYFTDTAISVIALIGVIFLAGVVVNNAIVLVDAVNRGRHDGMEKLEAVVHACKIRMRPIVMTTLTTVLGLLPMAVGFGEGSELRTPLAIVVSAGLVVSTLLTLVVIPALYLVVPSNVTTLIEEEELEQAIQEATRHEEESHLLQTKEQTP